MPGADHFELLGRPLEDDSFDNNYFLQVLDDIKTIHYLSSCTTPSKFSTDEVTTAIKRLNSNRAADPQGLMAEHLKHAPAIVCTFITDLFNAISATSYIPSRDVLWRHYYHPEERQGPTSYEQS